MAGAYGHWSVEWTFGTGTEPPRPENDGWEVHMFEIASRVLHEQPTVVCRTRLRTAEIGDWLGPTYLKTARAAGAAICGPAFARYDMIGERAEVFEVEAGFPVSGPIEVNGGVEMGVLPGGMAATTVYVGPYDGMTPAYEAVQAWIRERGARPDGAAWEVYYSDPREEPDPASWRTEIIQPYTT